MIFTTLLTLFTLTFAIPIPQPRQTFPTSLCASLDIWSEYKQLGIDLMSSEDDYPDYSNLTSDTLTLRTESIDLGKFRDWTGKVVEKYPGKQLKFNVWAVNVTLQSKDLEAVTVTCKKCLKRDPQRKWACTKYDVKTKTSSINRRFSWGHSMEINIFSSRFISPWSISDISGYETTISNEEVDHDQYSCESDHSYATLYLNDDGLANFNIDSSELIGYGGLTGVSHRFGTVNNTNLVLNGNVDTLTYWSWYACARRLASWNFRSATQEEAKYAYNLVTGIVSRLSNLDSQRQTSSLDSLLIMSQSLSQSIQNQYGVWNTSDNTFVPANVLVSKWSVDKLQSKLTNLGSFATSYSQKLQKGLEAGATDETRLENLKDMATLQSNSADSNEFNLEQSMQQMTSYESSVSSLTSQTETLGKDVETANDKFKKGVEEYKDKKTSESVWSFFTSITKIGMGIFSGDIADAFDGVTEFFDSIEELQNLLKDMEELNGLIQDLSGLLDDDTLKDLPTNTTDLTVFVEMVGKGNYTSALFSDSIRASLLKLSQFDRATADKIAVKYDTVGQTIGTLMKSSEDNDIDGATDLDVAYKKLCVSGKATINAKIGYAQAKSDFASKLYQVITDTRSSNYISGQISSTEAKLLAGKQQFLSWGIPGAISVQSILLDNLASICSSFYYTEAQECSVVNDKTLKAFSLNGMDDFVSSVLKGAMALEDASPLSRQAWTIVDAPLTISYNDSLGKKIIESFRQTGTTTIPASVFESIPRLQYLSAVCMLSASVEIVGATPSSTGNKEVEVFVGTMSSPVNQKTSQNQWIHFKTPTMNIKSSYQIGNRDKNVDMPFWSVEGKLYDTSSRFCRTPFQDFVLKVGKTSDGLDWNNVTGIKLYLYGNANTAQVNVDLGPVDLNNSTQELWDGVTPRKYVSQDYIVGW